MTDATTTETVTVPKSVLGPVISAVLHIYGRDKNAVTAETAAAILNAVKPPSPTDTNDDDTVTLDAEQAWWLAHECDATHVYGLDKEADSTDRHPAVVARRALMKLVADQAPKTTRRLLAAAMQAEAAMQVRRR